MFKMFVLLPCHADPLFGKARIESIIKITTVLEGGLAFYRTLKNMLCRM